MKKSKLFVYGLLFLSSSFWSFSGGGEMDSIESDFECCMSYEINAEGVAEAKFEAYIQAFNDCCCGCQP